MPSHPLRDIAPAQPPRPQASIQTGPIVNACQVVMPVSFDWTLAGPLWFRPIARFGSILIGPHQTLIHAREQGVAEMR
ncbi:MAG: hypothetical protein HBSAPP02_26740 [Phycisphaerae bacterium]|nr:MAG: hypothetical protein HBSAPP02_26740 [Phycisphaerae bacterium]